jgi:protein gp37
MTTIEWTDETWNPVTGCTKVSAGCKNCYAEKVAKRFWGHRRFEDVRFHDERLTIPLRWRKPRKVFVNSMSDLFHDGVPDDFIDRVFAIMSLCPQHTFQVLTKRPETMRRYMTRGLVGKADGFHMGHRIARIASELLAAMPGGPHIDRACAAPFYARAPWPLPNVWLGVSCEDQRAADGRIPLLLETPAAVRFISAEPLIGPIDLRYIKDGDEPFDSFRPRGQREPCDTTGIDWVIVGGESGPSARPCEVRWIRMIVAQCKNAAVPCFVKQLGSNIVTHHPMDAASLLPVRTVDSKGADMAEWPQDLCVRQEPKP